MLRPGNKWYLPPLLVTLVFVGGPLLVQIGVLAPIDGFKTFAASALFGVISLLWGVRLFFANARSKALVAVVFGLVPLGVIGSGMAAGAKVPRINDISTDLDNPPRFTAAALDAPENKGSDLSYPEDFKSEVRAGYPDLISKPMAMSTADAYAKVEAAAEKMPGWTIVKTDRSAMTVEGTETSGIFKFVDDFVIRVEPLGTTDTESTKALVAMRSRSRVGKGDFGVNAKRIRRFFAALDASGK